jgi:hypothetical protein
LGLLERKIDGLDVGGKTALDWYSVRHYVSQQEANHLYGFVATKLPNWFLERFPSEHHQKKLFKEQPDKLPHITAFENRPDGPAFLPPRERFWNSLVKSVCASLSKKHANSWKAPTVSVWRSCASC